MRGILSWRGTLFFLSCLAQSVHTGVCWLLDKCGKDFCIKNLPTGWLILPPPLCIRHDLGMHSGPDCDPLRPLRLWLSALLDYTYQGKLQLSLCVTLLFWPFLNTRWIVINVWHAWHFDRCVWPHWFASVVTSKLCVTRGFPIVRSLCVWSCVSGYVYVCICVYV